MKSVRWENVETMTQHSPPQQPHKINEREGKKNKTERVSQEIRSKRRRKERKNKTRKMTTEKDILEEQRIN
jgi:hypothetical protein